VFDEGKLTSRPPSGRARATTLARLEDVDTERVVAIGHSAGGYLAAWAAGRSKLAASAPGAGPVIEIGGVISLAGVLDLGAAAHEKIGNGVAIDLMGASPHERPERHAVADPLSQVPIPAVVRCVHARADDRVPLAESVTYVEAATATGRDAQLLEQDMGRSHGRHRGTTPAATGEPPDRRRGGSHGRRDAEGYVSRGWFRAFWVHVLSGTHPPD
jgi:acetyl esterase/lipase